MPSRFAVPRALFYRYIKGLSRHVSNILSPVVMPVDRVDFHKREKESLDPEEKTRSSRLG